MTDQIYYRILFLVVMLESVKVEIVDRQLDVSVASSQSFDHRIDIVRVLDLASQNS